MAYKIVENFLNQAHNYRNRVLYSFVDQVTGLWMTTSWKSFLEKTRRIASGLIAEGVREGDLVAVCSPNCPQIFSLDYALFMIRAVSVPVNPGDSQATFDHIMNLTEASVIFVGDRNQLETVRTYMRDKPDNKVRRIVVINADDREREAFDGMTESVWDLMDKGDDGPTACELDRRMAAGDASDLAVVAFTTDAAGEPKGVMLCHEQIDACIEMHDRFFVRLEEDMVSLSYLPMSHIFEKMWLYMCVRRGLRIVFCYDAGEMPEILRQVTPDVMCCVPRFWEKLYSSFFDYYNRQGWLGRRLIKRAFYIGKRRNLYYRRTGRRVPRRVEREYHFWDRRVFARLRREAGLGDHGLYPTSGSVLNDKIMGFMLKAGFDILLGFGSPETTSMVTIFPWLNPVVGTVGQPLDNIRLRIADDGEILVKSPAVMKGYYKDRQATEAVFGSDGYLRTGDLGYINADGSLVVTGRKHDIYKTSTGKTIPPRLIEKKLMESPLIDRAVTVADARKCVTALVYPCMEALRSRAKADHWVYADDDELLGLPQTRALLMSEIEEWQKPLASYMHVRNIAVMHRDLSKEAGEIGSGGKLRRRVIRHNFMPLVETLYPGEVVDAEPLFESHQPMGGSQ